MAGVAAAAPRFSGRGPRMTPWGFHVDLRLSNCMHAHHTRPNAKPLAMWLRTNQMTIAPGMMVKTPAAVRTP